MNKFTKWVSCWGNATSYREQTELRYTKDITLRYPIRICFDGDALRVRFSNLTGTEPVILRATLAYTKGERSIDLDMCQDILVNGKSEFAIEPGKEIQSDVIDLDIRAGQEISISIYLPYVTEMNAGVLITGPLSKGFYSYGSYEREEELPLDLTRNTNWFYFLNTIDIHTKEENHALICYGDSITAQDWPDVLALRAWDEGYRNCAIIRRAVSGTRILRQYDCITYKAYGLKGETRFPIEMNVSGAKNVLIQHGINDIIHPVGTDVNPWRPMSDLPTAKELEEGFKDLYIKKARELGYGVYGGTLLPIEGWRTYAPFREALKNEFNDWLRTTKLLDGCVDFDKAVRNEENPKAFKAGLDSGDHLHPSKAGYIAMAYAVSAELLKQLKGEMRFVYLFFKFDF